MRIINPVIVEPLGVEWDVAKTSSVTTWRCNRRAARGRRIAALAQGAFIAFLERLKNFKVVDPACGSGNFLYLALRALKDLEHKANLEAEMLGLQRTPSIEVSPANVLGIEINPYATELARVTVWIGEIQWMRKNGYPIRKNPILQSLDHIENRDALLAVIPAQAGIQSIEKLDPRLRGDDESVVEADWPAVDVIVGNPPFLGGSKMRGELGDDYVAALRHCYEGRVPGGADLVTYWFEKARAQIAAGACQRAGLVATQSIRKGSNQKVLARILNNAVIPAKAGIQLNQNLDSRFRGNDKTLSIFNAWSDEEWVNEGAAVRVSLVCFATSVVPAQAGIQSFMLDGNTVDAIHADLTAGSGLNLTLAQQPLKENAGVCFQGPEKNGAFDIDGEMGAAAMAETPQSAWPPEQRGAQASIQWNGCCTQIFRWMGD